jgi:hypothetical protein
LLSLYGDEPNPSMRSREVSFMTNSLVNSF